MKKINLISVLTISLLLTSCYSHKKVVNSGKPYSKDISWPKGYKPSESGFFVHNEIVIKASPQVVWDIFIEAEKWQDYYEDAKGLKVQNSTDGKLSPTAVFTWYPAGKFTSTIKKFEPPYEIAWHAEEENMKMTVYHAWLIIPTKDGCKMISQESQNGPRTFWEKVFVPKMMTKKHAKWLNEIKQLAESKTLKMT